MRRKRAYRTASLVMVFTTLLGGALSAAADDQPVPIKGQVNERVTNITPEADGVHVTAAGQGIASHLGRFTSIENAIVYADGTARSTVVLTAANGDRLFWTDVATPTSPTTTVGIITFTGGTGRFRNASGTAQFGFVLTPQGGTLTFEGTIRF